MFIPNGAGDSRVAYEGAWTIVCDGTSRPRTGCAITSPPWVVYPAARSRSLQSRAILSCSPVARSASSRSCETRRLAWASCWRRSSSAVLSCSMACPRDVDAWALSSSRSGLGRRTCSDAGAERGCWLSWLAGLWVDSSTSGAGVVEPPRPLPRPRPLGVVSPRPRGEAVPRPRPRGAGVDAEANGCTLLRATPLLRVALRVLRREAGVSIGMGRK